MSITVDTVVEPVGLIRKLDFDMLPKIYLGFIYLKSLPHTSSYI